MISHQLVIIFDIIYAFLLFKYDKFALAWGRCNISASIKQDRRQVYQSALQLTVYLLSSYATHNNLSNHINVVDDRSFISWQAQRGDIHIKEECCVEKTATFITVSRWLTPMYSYFCRLNVAKYSAVRWLMILAACLSRYECERWQTTHVKWFSRCDELKLFGKYTFFP